MSSFLEWESKILDKKIQKQLKKLSKQQKIDNFSSNLEFGTAGMRGKMQLGTNCVNNLTVSKLSKAVADYLNLTTMPKKVVVCFDTRHNSKSFSRIFSKILLDNDIDVYLFKNFAPTPLCVYATTLVGASLGVMITASHNNKEFNGIKIYDKYGIQIDDQTQQKISQIFNDTNEIEIYNEVYNKKVSKQPWVTNNSILDKFIKQNKTKIKNNLKIVYTPLNGTGYYCVSKLLKNNGYKFSVPKTQKFADGNFLTCPYPNPEFIEAFSESLKLAKKKNADIIVATDPDADRIGVMTLHNGEYVKISGNEVGYIFAEYLIQKNTNKNSFIVTSVVTSPLIEDICKQNNIELYKTLTGFKSLGTKAKQLKENKKQQLLVYEESCGYVVKDSYFDKDGIYASLLICDIAQQLKNQNKTLIDYLNEIYNKYGFISSLSDSITYSGAQSKQQMNKTVQGLRDNPPTSVLGQKIIKITDYLLDNTGLPTQNFIEYKSKDITFIIRPSGTEPKLKIYLFAKCNKEDANEYTQQILKDIRTNILK